MLEKVAERHGEWVSMAMANGCPQSLSEDVIQEVYLRLHKYRERAIEKLILDDGSVSTFYMFVTIRNTVRTVMKSESKYISCEELYIDSDDNEIDMEYEYKFDELMTKIRQEVDTWDSEGAYHSKMFNLYFKLGMTMREISEAGSELMEDKISLNHVYRSVNRYKEIILEKFSEDFQKLNLDSDE